MKSKEEDLLNSGCENVRKDSFDLYGSRSNAEQFLPQLSVSQLRQLSPTALAYLGDAVYELYIRRYYLLPPRRVENYHLLVVSQVRAEKQAKMLNLLIPHLNNNELEIVRRGRNAATGRPKRVDPQTYRQATSLETLIGYLYLTDTERLSELLQKLIIE
ncbi:Mini-ribonuclease 3 [Rivularia sp. UHCC 0363]|uniref:Mini-ribonuclease 3 n=1 Tax=Rivularia sp. UHCC 0363 TaxID=3110244 RepID=UPI002B20D18C|nr:ribonuclease III domain-containing protein [Rivularia sp. UHCC 0363]MEA5595590.1 ribonuclease III domain-containing protein [Rivularia sp. UHCC 0363]